MKKRVSEVILSWNDIQSNFNHMKNMSCKPTAFKQLPKDYIFDENQSVKWNREQVDINNQKYKDEVARLNTEKNLNRDNLKKQIIQKIKFEIGNSISDKQAEAIYDRAYESGHAEGFYRVIDDLQNLIELAKLLLEGTLR